MQCIDILYIISLEDTSCKNLKVKPRITEWYQKLVYRKKFAVKIGILIKSF